MARNKGTFAAPFNFQVKMQEAFDPRTSVSTKADLINKETWPYDGDTIYLYKGLVVSVADDNALYMLVDMTKITASDYSGWLRVDAGNAKQVEIVDNLESDASDKALSAQQGKVLMNEISGVKQKLTNIYTYKGSKATYAELPTNAVAGDVWNVDEAYDGHAAGTNWAWTGEAWDALAGNIDLSNYFNKEEVNAAIKVETDRAQRKEQQIEQQIETLENEVDNNFLRKTGGKISGSIAPMAIQSHPWGNSPISQEILHGVVTYDELDITDGNHTVAMRELLKMLCVFYNGTNHLSYQDVMIKVPIVTVTGGDSVDSFAEVLIANTGNVVDHLPVVSRGVFHIGRTDVDVDNGGRGQDVLFGTYAGDFWSDGVATASQLLVITEKNTAQDTRLTNLEKLVSGGEAGEGGTTLLEMVNQNAANIEALQTTVGSTEAGKESGLALLIKQNAEAIELLNSDAETEGSVDYKIKQAFAWVYVE